MNAFDTPRSMASGKQRGAALVVGLLLLMVLTLLAISGMNTSTVELQMSGNFQYAQSAFQAAELGIEKALASGKFNTNTAVATNAATGDADQFAATTTFDCTKDGETLPLNAKGYSMGEGTGFSSYHYDVRSTGSAPRGAQATTVQSFYVMGPSGGC
jgi:type IV pilus assembly protein PilX